MSRQKQLIRVIAEYSSEFVAIGIIILHLTLVLLSAVLHSPTLNETPHLVTGLYGWKTGRFDLDRVNPPLARLVAATPVMLSGYRMDWRMPISNSGSRPFIRLGSVFIKQNGTNTRLLLMKARCACLTFTILGAVICYRWSLELWQNKIAGIVSVFFWCFNPDIIAHAEYVTSDCAGAAMAVAAGYTFWRWSINPHYSRAIIAGIMLGLALATKFTLLVLVPAWMVIFLIIISSSSFNKHIRTGLSPIGKYALFTSFSILLVTSLHIVNCFYLYRSFSPLGGFTFLSRALTGRTDGSPGNRFQGTIFENIPLPIPTDYIQGVDIQKRDLEVGKNAYLNGKWNKDGFYLYYITGILAKLPHGLQFCIAFSLLIIIWGSFSTRITSSPISMTILFLPVLLIIAACSANKAYNEHYRYIIPAFGNIFVACGSVATAFPVVKHSSLSMIQAYKSDQFC